MCPPPQIKLRDGIKLAMAVSAEANKFITDTEPFKVVKTDPEHAATLVAACECWYRGLAWGLVGWDGVWCNLFVVFCAFQYGAGHISV
jgi:hypothetical protein